MSKSLSKSNLSERSATRPLLAVFLCASMAAFGCTTDRNLGNGDPVVTPGVRSVPTGGSSAGSESEPVPPPMMSSSTDGSHPRIARLTADQAAAIMAQQQRVRVLGPASPDNGGRPYVSDRMMLPSQQIQSQYSVNSTIYSGPTAAVTTGAGEAVAGSDAAPSFLDTGTAATGTTVSGGTTVTNAAGPVITPAASVVTPTSSAVSTPAAFASVGTLSPTAAAVVNPPASISGSPAIATTSSARTAGTTATTNRTATTNTTATNANVTTNVGVANPVRVMNANGRVTITNTGSTRQQ